MIYIDLWFCLTMIYTHIKLKVVGARFFQEGETTNEMV